MNSWRIHGHRTGVGRYLVNIIKHWTTELVAGRFEEINLYTPKPVDRLEIPLPQNIRNRVLLPDFRMLIWENLRLGPVASDDVVWCPSYSRPVFARAKTVVTTHEATIRLYPQLYPLLARVMHSRLYGWSARQATLVITSTEAARQDIIRFYGVSPSRIRVVPLAPDEIFGPLPNGERLTEVRKRYLGSPTPFFLHVGKLTARRNIPKLMQAFAELKRKTLLPHKLIVIGLNNLKLDIGRLAVELGISDHMVYREYVTDEELNLLYNAAEAFVLPYTYEALSLTALEAQATGTPVITTDTSGLREMTGGAALLISKAEVPEIVRAMIDLAENPNLRRELSEKGLKHAQQFSWRRSASETLAVLEEATQLPTSFCSAPRRAY